MLCVFVNKGMDKERLFSATLQGTRLSPLSLPLSHVNDLRIYLHNVYWEIEIEAIISSTPFLAMNI